MGYSDLAIEHTRLIQVARNCAIEFGINSREFIEASQEAQIIGMRLKNIEAAIATSTAGGGNYASSY